MNKQEAEFAKNVLRQIVGIYLWQQCECGDGEKDLEYQMIHWAENRMEELRLILLDRPEEDVFERLGALADSLEAWGLSCGARRVPGEEEEESEE